MLYIGTATFCGISDSLHYNHKASVSDTNRDGDGSSYWLQLAPPLSKIRVTFRIVLCQCNCAMCLRLVNTLQLFIRTYRN